MASRAFTEFDGLHLTDFSARAHFVASPLCLPVPPPGPTATRYPRILRPRYVRVNAERRMEGGTLFSWRPATRTIASESSPPVPSTSRELQGRQRVFDDQRTARHDTTRSRQLTHARSPRVL